MLKMGIGFESEKSANRLGIKWYGNKLRYISRVAIEWK